MTVSASSGLLRRGGVLDDAQQVALLHDEKFFAVDLDLRAGPFGEQHPVARLYVERHQLALFVPATRPGGDHPALGAGMRMPPAVFSSASMRRTSTRSCDGRKCMHILLTIQRCHKTGAVT